MPNNKTILSAFQFLLFITLGNLLFANESGLKDKTYECFGEECIESFNESSCKDDDQRCKACKKVCKQTYTSCIESSSNDDQKKHCEEQFAECNKVCITSELSPSKKSTSKRQNVLTTNEIIPNSNIVECRVLNNPHRKKCTYSSRVSRIELKKNGPVRVRMLAKENVSVLGVALISAEGSIYYFEGNLDGSGELQNLPEGVYTIRPDWRYVLGTGQWPKYFQVLISG